MVKITNCSVIFTHNLYIAIFNEIEMKEGNILIVDDNEEILLALKILLGEYFTKADTLNDPSRIMEYIPKKHYDVFILDMNFRSGVSTGNEGIYWMNKIFEYDPEAGIIFITAYGDIDLAVKAIKKGAIDFIQKPWDDEKLITTVLNAYKLKISNQKIKQLKSKQKHLSSFMEANHPGLIGNSEELLKIKDTIKKVAPTDANILVLGDSGTGKEVLAREIHKYSHRSGELFIHVDLGSIPENLFESELFGFEKGAFTDAKETKPGRFEVASGGTLFLDEIGNLPLSLQHKLLQAIQNKHITRLGSNKPISVDVRIVAATNMPLYEMIEEGTFRQDLLYRINTIEMELPPLRDRKDDIPALSEYFIQEFRKKYNKNRIRITSEGLQKLQEYNWPGNIRELHHILEKAMILCEKDQLTRDDIFIKPEARKVNNFEYETFNLEDHEKKIIQKAIKKNYGNLTQTFKDLGISRKTLYNKMKKYGL